ncbi:MAG: UvrD-helicase domain-containing protein [Clostridia bacterium]|nr:UvrD-helicase domain-containing protein [Clostridia bacterium]
MTDLSKLNPQQQLAAETLEGPVLILAGAGSGKTRALTYRMANMIDRGIAPWNILMITFTNKAAREMRQRADRLCDGRSGDAWIMTFHACCARILRRDIEKLGYSRDFSIYDEDDKTVVIKRAIKALGINEKNYTPRMVRSVISDAKNRMLSPEEWLLENNDIRSKPYYLIYKYYEDALKANNALDFDDLLIKTLELLSEQPPVLEYYQNRFRYIMVDEYQDTNVAQYQFVRLLSAQSKNLCVVGDDDQSIYSWRGADIRNILSFEKDFPGCTVIKLEENYRSTGTILQAANKVIKNNSARKAKALWTQADEGEKIRFYRASDEREEAAWVCENIQALTRQGMEYGDMAVLYRTNAQSRVLEEALVRRGIKYGVYGGLKFYDRKEIKDIIAYLRLLVNPADEISFRRVINEPRRGIGDVTLETLAQFAQNMGISMQEALERGLLPDVGARARNALRGFGELMRELKSKLATTPADELVEALIEGTGIVKQYEDSKDPEDVSRVENIRELVSAVGEYVRQNPEDGLTGFLENVALVTDTDRLEEGTQLVTLMTLHSAKGLEFGAVFIVGLEETIFPITRSMMDDEQLEEERRLMYVGITRAKKLLFLSCARNRIMYNERSCNPISRFVAEIPRELIDDGRRAMNPVRLGPSSPNQRLDAYRGAGRAQTPGASKAKLEDIAGLQKGFGAPRATLFHVGDRVQHRSFGFGTVVEVRPDGRVIVVDFGRGFGLKPVDANMAPMKLVK